jgi:hypothetical protein
MAKHRRYKRDAEGRFAEADEAVKRRKHRRTHAKKAHANGRKHHKKLYSRRTIFTWF